MYPLDETVVVHLLIFVKSSFAPKKSFSENTTDCDLPSALFLTKINFAV